MFSVGCAVSEEHALNHSFKLEKARYFFLVSYRHAKPKR